MPERRPRLVYVVTLAEVGGAQSYVRDLLPAMRDRFDVTVAAHGEGPLRVAAGELGIPFVPLRHVRRPLSAVHDPLGLIELSRLFRRLQPDIVHLNSSKAGVLGRLAAALVRVPVCVFTAHGWAFKATTGTGSQLFRLADRAVKPLSSTIVCVSETELSSGLAARVCTVEGSLVIPNAVEPGPAPAPRPPRTGPVEIVSVGRLAPPKDFSTLLEAVQSLAPHELRVTVLGDGPLRASLEAEVSQRGLAGIVEFRGEVADVRRYLAQADIFVLSSRSEGMPISVLEAMAAGLPVIASAVGGLREVVDEGVTGFLLPPGSATDLAERLRRLVDAPQLRERLGREGRRRVEERFALPGWQDAHLALYASLLDGKPGHHSLRAKRR